MRRFLLSALVVLSVAPLAVAEDLTGTWKGTHESETVYCSVPIKSTGRMEMVIRQNGDAISGTLLWVFQNPTACVPTTEYSEIDLTFAGTVNGSSLTATVFYEEEAVGTFNGSVTGSVMTFVWEIPKDGGGVDTRISGTLTRQSTPPPPNSNVVVSSFPTGMVQGIDQTTATDSFALTNTGTAAANIVLSTTDDFFSVAPASFTLAPRATATIGIRAIAQSVAGSRTGSVAIGGAAVSAIRITLLTGDTAVPAGRLTGPAARPETLGPAELIVVNGVVSFTNSGTSTLLAVAVSDVPWIVPQSGTITLPPGQTVAVPFQVDRSKRTDAAALLGGAAGKLSLRFVGSGTSTTAAQSVEARGTTTVSNIVSVQIVDVVQPGTSNQNIPPLQPGEIAYFVSGLGGRGNKLTDLLLSNRGAAKTTDFNMYFNALGASGPAKSLNVLQGFDPNVAVSFPSMAKNVFGAANQIGTLQIRGSSASGMAVAAVQLASPVSGRYATALPILRSDRAAAPGEHILLAGLEKNASTSSTLYIQEAGGAHGTARIDFLTGAGAPLSPPRAPDPIDGFELLEVPVPAGASVARIVNAGFGPSRLAAYAMVTDDVTGDSWVVTDLIRSGTPPSSLFIVPLVSLDAPGPARELFLTNGSASTIDLTVDQLSAGRRHAARSLDLTHEPEPLATLAIPSQQTAAPAVTIGSGHLRISGTAGTFSGSARVTAPSPAGGSFGTGLIAVGVNEALRAGQSKRITGIDDSSAASRAAATPGTYRSTLILVEPEGQSAKVRLTLRFVFASGTKVSAYATSTREITLQAKQMITLADLARAIIGPERDALGDLVNSQLDVEVLEGAVIAVVQSTDNGSGDVVMRD